MGDVISVDRTAVDITANLDTSPLEVLTREQRDVVITLMARAAERAYRRGAQQALTCAANRPGDIRADLTAWRYGPSADDAPWLDAARVQTATDRLFTECPQLRRLGFEHPFWDSIMPELRTDPTYRPAAAGAN